MSTLRYRYQFKFTLMNSWWKRFRNLTRAGSNVSRFAIIVKDDSVIIEDATDDDRQRLVFPWNEINQIVAYRKDVYAGDLICLGMELANARVIELNERMRGWDRLLVSLPLHLAGAMNMKKVILELLAKDTSDAITIFSREE